MDTELCCLEEDSPGPHQQTRINRAMLDPVLLKNDRVLRNLLEAEDRYLPNPNYFCCVQNDIQPWMRDSVAHWMLEVCEEEKREDEVLPLAMNYMDRFLSIVCVQRSQLQLLGAVCLFVASKLKETLPLTAEKLVLFTDCSITITDLVHWERLLIQKLKWDLSAITPHDFLQQFLTRISLTCEQCQLVKRHAQIFISLCYIADLKFVMYPPSMIAAGSLCAAANGVLNSNWRAKRDIFTKLQQITNIDTDCLQGCLEQIEKILAQSLPSEGGLGSQMEMPHTPPLSKYSSTSQPTTPTDVRDISLM